MLCVILIGSHTYTHCMLACCDIIFVSNFRVGHDISDNFDSMMSLVEQSHQQGLAKYAHPVCPVHSVSYYL